MTFRSRLGPYLFQALAFTLIVYFVLKAMDGFKGTIVAVYPFGFAGLFALAYVALKLLTTYRPDGLHVDRTGLRDLGSGTFVRWDDVDGVRLSIEKTPLKSGKFAMCRIATVSGAGHAIAFGDLGPSFPSRVAGTLNLEGSALVLAAVAARTKSRDLFPASWTETGAPAGDDEADVDADADLGSAKASSEQRTSIIAAGAKLLMKGGAVALKLLKAIKPGAVLVTLAAYSLVFSWQFAVGLMVMIGVHECGHVFAMWRSGVKVKGIYFVPFFGGVAVAKGVAGTRAQSAYIALNGPVWGTLLAIACLVLYFATGMQHPWLAAGAGWGALLNLFNLMPIFPLDGGRVTASLAHATGRGSLLVVASLLLGVALAYVADFQLLMLVALLGLFELGAHVASVPYRAALEVIDPLPFGADEAEHFDRLVARVHEGATSEAQKEARLGRYGPRIDAARQTPMRGAQRLAVLGAYVGLVAVLVSLTVIAARIPGSGVNLGILH